MVKSISKKNNFNNSNKTIRKTSKKGLFLNHKYKLLVSLGVLCVVGIVIGILFATGVLGKKEKSGISASKKKKLVIEKYKEKIKDLVKEIKDLVKEMIEILNKMDENLKKLEINLKNSFKINETNLELFKSNILEANKLDKKYKKYEMVDDDEYIESIFKKETEQDFKYFAKLKHDIDTNNYESDKKYVKLVEDYLEFYYYILDNLNLEGEVLAKRHETTLFARKQLQITIEANYRDKLKKEIEFYINKYKNKRLEDEKDKEIQIKLQDLLVRYTSEQYEGKILSRILLIIKIKKEFEAIKNNA